MKCGSCSKPSSPSPKRTRLESVYSSSSLLSYPIHHWIDPLVIPLSRPVDLHVQATWRRYPPMILLMRQFLHASWSCRARPAAIVRLLSDFALSGAGFILRLLGSRNVAGHVTIAANQKAETRARAVRDILTDRQTSSGYIAAGDAGGTVVVWLVSPCTCPTLGAVHVRVLRRHDNASHCTRNNARQIKQTARVAVYFWNLPRVL